MGYADADLTATAPACNVCGREWSQDKNPEDWLGVEVDTVGGRLFAAFCSREHAQAWFSRPLPDVAPRTPAPSLRATERALIAGVGVLAVIATTVFVLGLVTVVRTAAGWL